MSTKISWQIGKKPHFPDSRPTLCWVFFSWLVPELFFQIQDAWQVVTVRVIDAGSGRETTYRAYKSDVGGRTFTTTDGRTVKLADVERMELGER